MRKSIWGLHLGFILLASFSAHAQGGTWNVANARAVATRYAPLIFFARGERFFPSSIEFFDQYTYVNCENANVSNSVFTYPNATAAHMGRPGIRYMDLPVDFQKDLCHLTTRTEIPSGNPTHELEFFYGQLPSSGMPLSPSLQVPGVVPDWLKKPVPIYVSLYPVDTNRFNAQYSTFYPYNFGKKVVTQFGNHVGDWEALTIQFTNGKPTGLFLGAHNTDDGNTSKAYFKGGEGSVWNLDNAIFWANDQGGLRIGAFNEAYPHPVPFAAEGAHGLWGHIGSPVHKDIVVAKLTDETSMGLPWRPWENIVWRDNAGPDVPYWVPSSPPNTAANAYNQRFPSAYKGRWGNRQLGTPIFGQYPLEEGPSTPDVKRDKTKLVRNFTFDKPAAQSSEAYGGAAPRATDGNDIGFWGEGSVTHTLEERTPAWWTDLGLGLWLDHVTIWNRADCCTERLSNFHVDVSLDGTSWTTAAQYPGTAPVGPTTLDLRNAAARFVRIQLNDTGVARPLSLTEVRVEPNWAYKQVVLQSTTAYAGDASRAVDGDTNGNYAFNSVTHTAEEYSPWWQVGLANSIFISRVEIWNRTDCCTERLSNFHVDVSANGVDWTTIQFPGTASGVTSFEFNQMGRYVRVQLNNNGFPRPLSLAEVKIF